MRSRQYLTVILSALVVLSTAVSGCAVNFYKQSPRSAKQIGQLQAQISDLEAQRDAERRNFEDIKKKLEQSLRQQIREDQVSLEVSDRGLVIILSDDILFDSGKATLRNDVDPVLDKVAYIIKANVPDKNIGVTGHTDNVPIKYSGWKSNWELSTARATTVLHYLEEKGVSPKKLSATGYGEHRPIASNETSQGRAKNRRVEIVILPEFVEERDATIVEESIDSNIK